MFVYYKKKFNISSQCYKDTIKSLETSQNQQYLTLYKEL